MPSEPFVGVLLSRNDCLAGFLSADETQAAVTDDTVTDESTLPQNFGPEPEQVARFIEHWAPSGGAERANFPSFAHNLCDVLAVPHPEPTLPDVSENAYVFERDVTFQNLDGSTSIGRIDFYKRGCFVLEAKQEWFRTLRCSASSFANDEPPGSPRWPRFSAALIPAQVSCVPVT
jgi:hypothetical protein